MTDVQIVNNFLHFLWRSPWSSRQGDHTEMRMIRHEIRDALDVRMISSCFVGLVFKSSTCIKSISMVYIHHKFEATYRR